MKRFLLLPLFLLTLFGCGEGRLDLITSDVISDAAGCYQSIEADGDTYFIALDKNCVDIELSGLGSPAVETVPDTPTVNLVTPEVTCPNPDNSWELIATLERNPLQPYQFYVPDELVDPINGAYEEGKDFIFVIKGGVSINNKQFYIQQQGQPVFEEGFAPPGHIHFKIFRWHFPSEPTWYRFTRGAPGFEHLQDRTYAGLSVEFDLTPDLNKPPKRKYWQPPKFGVGENASRGLSGSGVIFDGRQLQISVSK